MHAAVAIMEARMKRLPRRHRKAHLRALIERQPTGSLRREQLVALLRKELTAQRPATSAFIFSQHEGNQ